MLQNPAVSCTQRCCRLACAWRIPPEPQHRKKRNVVKLDCGEWTLGFFVRFWEVDRGPPVTAMGAILLPVKQHGERLPPNDRLRSNFAALFGFERGTPYVSPCRASRTQQTSQGGFVSGL